MSLNVAQFRPATHTTFLWKLPMSHNVAHNNGDLGPQSMPDGILSQNVKIME
jgi:hypothetical protein